MIECPSYGVWREIIWWSNLPPINTVKVMNGDVVYGNVITTTNWKVPI